MYNVYTALHRHSCPALGPVQSANQHNIKDRVFPRIIFHRADRLRMSFFWIPIGLVPRAMVVQMCVKAAVIMTLLGRLVFLASLIIGNNALCKNIFKVLNIEASQTLIDSRIIPLGLWIVLFILPFFFITILSNLTDLGFLIRHPDILIFGNISHFQISPKSSCCSDVK